MILDLWPPHLTDDLPLTNTPLAILREQASWLGKRTNNLIEAEVKTHAEDDTLFHEFWVDAPALRFSHLLFYVSHQVADLYPALVAIPGQQPQTVLSIRDETRLVETLRELFASGRILKPIQALLAYSRGPISNRYVPPLR